MRFVGPAASSSRRESLGARGDAATRLARAILCAAALAAGASAVIGAVNALIFDSRFLDPNEEGSLFQLLTVAATALAGAAAAVRALRLPAWRIRFAALAPILLYFAVDDLLEIHERLGEQVGEGLFGLPDYLAVRMWILVLAPLLVAAFGLLAAAALRAAPPLGRVLLGGLGALVAAVAVEVVGVVTRSPTFIERLSGKPETLRLLVEESFELGGWVLIAGALSALVANELRSGATRPADARPR